MAGLPRTPQAKGRLSENEIHGSSNFKSLDSPMPVKGQRSKLGEIPVNRIHGLPLALDKADVCKPAPSPSMAKKDHIRVINLQQDVNAYREECERLETKCAQLSAENNDLRRCLHSVSRGEATSSPTQSTDQSQALRAKDRAIASMVASFNERELSLELQLESLRAENVRLLASAERMESTRISVLKLEEEVNQWKSVAFAKEVELSAALARCEDLEQQLFEREEDDIEEQEQEEEEDEGADAGADADADARRAALEGLRNLSPCQPARERKQRIDYDARISSALEALAKASDATILNLSSSIPAPSTQAPASNTVSVEFGVDSHDLSFVPRPESLAADQQMNSSSCDTFASEVFAATAMVMDTDNAPETREAAAAAAEPMEQIQPSSSVVVQVHEESTAPAAIPLSPCVQRTVELHNMSAMTSPIASVAQFMSLAQTSSPSTLLQQIESVTISNELLRENLHAAQTELAEKTASLSALRVSLDSHASGMAARVASLEQQVEALADERNFLEAEKQALEEQVEGARSQRSTEHGEVADQLMVARQALKEKEAQVVDLENSLSALQTRLEQTQQEIAGVRADYEHRLAAQLSAHKNLQDDLRMAYHRHKKEVADLRQEFKQDAYEARYSELLSENNMLTARMQSLMQLAADLQGMADLQARAAAANTQAAAALHAREATVAQAQAAMRLEADEQQQRMENVKEQLQNVQFELEEARQLQEMTVAQGKQDQLAHNAALEKVQQELQQALADNTMLTDEIDALSSELQQIKLVAAEVPVLQQQLQALADEHTTKCAELDALCAQYDTLHAELEDANARLQKASESSSSRDKAAAQEVVDRLLNDQFELNSALEHAQSQFNEAVQQLEMKTHQYDELKEFIEEERTIRNEVIVDLERDRDVFQDKIQQLEKDVAAKAAEIASLKEAAASVAERAQEEIAREKRNMSAELLHAKATAERLSGEMVEKELSLFEVQSQLEASMAEAKKATEELSRHKARDEEITYLKNYMKEYQERAQAKIAVLQENLEQAEKEVAELDAELARVQQRK